MACANIMRSPIISQYLNISTVVVVVGIDVLALPLPLPLPLSQSPIGGCRFLLDYYVSKLYQYGLYGRWIEISNVISCVKWAYRLIINLLNRTTGLRIIVHIQPNTKYNQLFLCIVPVFCGIQSYSSTKFQINSDIKFIRWSSETSESTFKAYLQWTTDNWAYVKEEKAWIFEQC